MAADGQRRGRLRSGVVLEAYREALGRYWWCRANPRRYGVGAGAGRPDWS